MKKKQFGVEPAKFEKDPGYVDVKRADQIGDNDSDYAPSPPDEAKKATDESYLKNSAGVGTTPAEGRISSSANKLEVDYWRYSHTDTLSCKLK